ncbi:MAG: hypothetical protein Q7R49_02805 [Candidatus Daviesbacteria bacterium]|nr:hypothetical protein [Candidatus Daviesbacteria bacterium]
MVEKVDQSEVAVLSSTEVTTETVQSKSTTAIIEPTPIVNQAPELQLDRIQDNFWRRELVFNSLVILTGASLLLLSRDLSASVPNVVDFNWNLEVKAFGAGVILGGMLEAAEDSYNPRRFAFNALAGGVVIAILLAAAQVVH